MKGAKMLPVQSVCSSPSRLVRIVLALPVLSLCLALAGHSRAFAQEPSQTPDSVSPAPALIVPQQVRFAAKLPARSGDTVEAVFRIYAAAEGGEPLWAETQHVAIAEDGAYSVLLGAASPTGLPQSVFAGGAARWLAVCVDQGPESERVLLSSVPYAMKSADAESLAGHAASEFVTQAQLAQLTEAGSVTAPQPTPASNLVPNVSGSGTTGTIPIWTGALAQGNSLITQLASKIGINQVAPASTLDVGGSANVAGNLSLPILANATVAAGQRSQLIEFSSSSYSSSTKAPVTSTFKIISNFVGNNTANPAAQLEFHYQPTPTSASLNVLSIAGNGVITFSPSQTFPGAIKSVSATSPITAATTAGAVALGLDTTALETTLNTIYPQLATGNTFKSYLEAYQTAGPGNAALLGWGSNGSVGTFGDSDTGYGLQGESETGRGVQAEVLSPAPGSAGVMGIAGFNSNTFSSDTPYYNAGVWADTSGAGTGLPVSLFATADDAYGAVVQTKGADYPALWVTNAGGTAAVFTAASNLALNATIFSGTGIYVESEGGGNGVQAIALSKSAQNAGVLGISSGTSNSFSQYNMHGGVWGDTDTSSTAISPALAVGILGTADDSHAGVFINNSLDYPTLFALNAYSGGTTGLFKTFMAKSADGGTCGIGSGGSLSCTGQIKTLVSAGSGTRTVETYAVQSPENWMEDFGSGRLLNGVAVVSIDPAFSEIVAAGADYHVFLTPRGDSKGLYVINNTPTTFEVRESGGGVSSLEFDYRIVARRRGYEGQRLLDVTDRFQAEQKAATLAKGSGVAPPPTPHPFSLPASRLHNPGVNVHPRIEVPMHHPGSTTPVAQR